MAGLKRFTNRAKRKFKRIKKLRPKITLNNILLIIIIFKIYGFTI